MEATPSLRQQGMQALQEGNLDKATDLLARAVMADDKDNDAKALLGIAYSQKGLHAQAKRALETAVQMEPQNANYRFNLGVVLARAGEMPAAAAAYRDTLLVNPQHAQAKAKLQEFGGQLHQLLAAAPRLNVPAPEGAPAPSAQPAHAPPPPPMSGAPMGGAPIGAPPVQQATYAPPPAAMPTSGGDGSGGPPGTIQCQYCFKHAKLGMVCEFCSQPLPPPPKAVAPPPSMASMGMAGPPGSSAPVAGYAARQSGFDSGVSNSESAMRRWAAMFVDNLLMNGVGYAIGTAMGGAAKAGATPEQAFGAAGAAMGVAAGVQIAYMAGFTAFTGQTLGKMMLGMRVVGPDGGPPGIGRALLREAIGRPISVIVCMLGYFWILWDTEQQGWHDKIAGTHVEKT